MNNIQNVSPNIVSTGAAQGGEAREAKIGSQSPAPLLGGPSVTVTSAAYSDLEKLVARLKGEHDDMKLDVAKRRLASVLDVFSARHGQITERNDKDQQTLEEIAANDEAIDAKTKELEEVKAELAKGEGDAAVLQAQIESLQRAVAQAIEDGKTHRENVAKLKEQLAHDQDNEQLKAELEKEEAAVQAADGARDKAQSDLATAQAAAGALSAKIQALAGKQATLEGEISALNDKNAELVASLGTETLAQILAAFKEDVPELTAQRGPTHTSREKAEEKARANDPANVLHEALERMDEAILRDIDEKRDKKV